jgi:hypothetical protein
MEMQIAIMKMRITARGDPRVPVDDRLYFALAVDASVKCTVKPLPRYVYFSRYVVIERNALAVFELCVPLLF